MGVDDSPDQTLGHLATAVAPVNSFNLPLEHCALCRHNASAHVLSHAQECRHFTWPWSTGVFDQLSGPARAEQTQVVAHAKANGATSSGLQDLAIAS